MNELELRDGQIYLDGNLLKGVEKFKLKSTAENNCAELFVNYWLNCPEISSAIMDKKTPASYQVAGGVDFL